DWSALQGELTGSDEYIDFYKSKKPLDGFTTKLEDDYDFGSYFMAEMPEDSKNVQLFEDIRRAVQQLKNDGYTLKDEKTNPEMKSSYVLKRIDIYKDTKRIAYIQLSLGNDIFIEIEIE